MLINKTLAVLLAAIREEERNGRHFESKVVKTLAIICQEASSIGQWKS